MRDFAKVDEKAELLILCERRKLAERRVKKCTEKPGSAARNVKGLY